MADGSTGPIVAEPTFHPGESSALRALVLVARSYGVHLTVSQLVRDNLLSSSEVSDEELARCASSAGLAATSLKLSTRELRQLGARLPAILRLRNGSCMLLVSMQTDGETERFTLQDPTGLEEGQLVIDRVRLESAWDGHVIILKKRYDLRDEEQPFSLGLIASLIFRERRIVRDVTLCAVMLSFLCLLPILFMRLLTDRVLSNHAFNTFAILCIGLVVLTAFDTAFGFLKRQLVLHLTARSDVKLATYMFDRVVSLPVEFFERTPVGLIARDMNEVWKIRNFLSNQLFGTMLDSFVLLIFIPVMLIYSPLLTGVVLGLAALIVFWVIALLPAYRKRSGAVMAAEGERGSFLVQTLQGIRTVKSLSLDARQKNQWDVLVARATKLRMAEGTLANIIQAGVAPIERLIVSGTFAFGVYLAMSTNDPVYVGALFAFMMLSQRVASPLVQAARLVQQFDEAQTAVDTVSKLVNRAAEEGRSANAVKTPIEGKVEFVDVRFKYAGAVTPALDGVSFEVPPGTTLGIMGRSGSGKTTVTRLLQRLNSSYGGLVRIDGIDIRQFDLDHLRRSLGVVLQENFLFSGTIRENITIAKADATLEEVVQAARLAGAEEFIERLPMGYETYIYEGSPNLSGGQRQRLAIARALITKPAVLILDEATSALDAESEAIVNANLRRIAHGRTVLVISHRLSSLMSSDAILVMEKGCVSDIGRHEELLGRSEIYSSLWHQQNGHTRSSVRAAPTPQVIKGGRDG